MTQGRDVVQEVLEREAADCEAELSRLERQEQEISRRVTEVRLTLKAYRSILERRGGHERVIPPGSAPLLADLPPLSRETMVTSPITGGGRTPGNRNPAMPVRAMRFAELSVAKAILTLTAQWGTARRLDDFARAIWQVADANDMRKARRTLNSTIGRLAREGKIARDGVGRYGPKESSAMTT